MSFVERLFASSFYSMRRFFAPTLADQIAELGGDATSTKRHSLFASFLIGREYSLSFRPIPELVLMDQSITLPLRLLVLKNADDCIKYVLVQITTYLKDLVQKSVFELNQESIMQFPAVNEIKDRLSTEEREYCDTLLKELKLESNHLVAKETPNIFSSNQSNPKNTAKAQSSPKLRTIDLSSNPDNPLVHMFEKVQTAEDYQGGNRSIEDSESLSQDQSALDEMLFSTVVRTNQTSSGLLETESTWSGLGQDKNDDIRDPDKIILTKEWFQKQSRYADDWCQVFIKDEETNESAIPETPLEIKLLTKSLREKIECIFNKNTMVARQRVGEDFDLDALIRSLVDFRVTHQFDDRIYIHRKRMERDVGILFLIDTSMSTESWVRDESGIDLIKKFIAIAAGAFEGVIDHIQIDRFFSYTRKQCHYHHLKKFDESWTRVKKNTPIIRPEGYTRMGPAIRVASEQFARQKFRKKLIFVLSDCKPTDYDAYEGTHGNSDVRKAVLEAASKGIVTHAFVLTTKFSANAEMMFDKKRVSFVSSVPELSDRLFGILSLIFRGF